MRLPAMYEAPRRGLGPDFFADPVYLNLSGDADTATIFPPVGGASANEVVTGLGLSGAGALLTQVNGVPGVSNRFRSIGPSMYFNCDRALAQAAFQGNEWTVGQRVKSCNFTNGSGYFFYLDCYTSGASGFRAYISGYWATANYKAVGVCYRTLLLDTINAQMSTSPNAFPVGFDGWFVHTRKGDLSCIGFLNKGDRFPTTILECDAYAYARCSPNNFDFTTAGANFNYFNIVGEQDANSSLDALWGGLVVSRKAIGLPKKFVF